MSYEEQMAFDRYNNGKPIESVIPKVDLTGITQNIAGNLFRYCYLHRETNRQLRRDLLRSRQENESLRTKLETAEKRLMEPKKQESQHHVKKSGEGNVHWQMNEHQFQRKLSTIKKHHERRMETKRSEISRLRTVLLQRNAKLKLLREFQMVETLPTSFDNSLADRASRSQASIPSPDQLSLELYSTVLNNPEALRAPRLAQFDAEVLADPAVSEFVSSYSGSESILKFCRQFLVNPEARQEVPEIKGSDKYTKPFMSTLPLVPIHSVVSKILTRLRKLTREEQERQVELGWIVVKEENLVERVLSVEEIEALEKKTMDVEKQLLAKVLEDGTKSEHNLETTSDSEKTNNTTETESQRPLNQHDEMKIETSNEAVEATVSTSSMPKPEGEKLLNFHRNTSRAVESEKRAIECTRSNNPVESRVAYLEKKKDQPESVMNIVEPVMTTVVKMTGNCIENRTSILGREGSIKRAVERTKITNSKAKGAKKPKVSKVPSFEDCQAAEGMLMKKLHRDK